MRGGIKTSRQAGRDRDPTRSKILRQTFRAVQTVAGRPASADDRDLRQIGIPLFTTKIEHNWRIKDLAQHRRIPGVENVENRHLEILRPLPFGLCPFRRFRRQHIICNFWRNAESFQFIAIGVKDPFRLLKMLDQNVCRP